MIQLKKPVLQEFLPHHVKGESLKLKKNHKPSGTLNSSAFLNYMVSDSVFYAYYTGMYDFAYSEQTMNMNYTLIGLMNLR